MSGAAVSALLTFSGAAMATAETLADTLVAAYKHSGLLEQNRALLRAADEDVAQAVAALRPVINWSGEVVRNFGVNGGTSAFTGSFGTTGISSTTASINLIAELTLYNGGRNRLEIEAAKETVLATRAQLLAIEQEVLLRAVQAFMEVRRDLEIVALRRNNVRVITQELRAARDRFEVGEVTRTDVALAEARLSAAQSDLAAAEGELQISVEEYRAVTGQRPGTLQAPRSAPRLPGSQQVAETAAVRSHPEMVQARHDVAVGELSIRIAETAAKPTVTLSGRLGATEEFGERDYSRNGRIALEATGPIYQGGRLPSLVRQSMARRDAARGNLHVVRHQIRQNVGNAYARLGIAQSRISSTTDQVRASRVAFQGVREEATLGARTTLDVLDAEQELLDAQAALISAQVDQTIAAYSVLASIGELTAQSLRLNVPIYDPSDYYNLVKDSPAAKSKQGRDLDRVLRALGKE
ncbi:TolC family outer membrane protein [Thalassococcus sp. CAU 1522]|uniref:TolC family outer membrane protein n=2 Tax=Thalassococcus arenae TaxID=2851652 RepID=A0ABS6N3J6_9RHOB|nr:TolC family outer membrane protein [Thalassococcus arenae]MBV2358594.1 TolC family outer membrane protein [Thalassococcus arenae]